jgi:hypothetical protein
MSRTHKCQESRWPVAVSATEQRQYLHPAGETPSYAATNAQAVGVDSSEGGAVAIPESMSALVQNESGFARELPATIGLESLDP